MNRRRRPPRQAGIVLLGVLLFLAVTAIASANLLRLGVLASRRDAEAALLDVGQEFAAALESYWRATPAGGATMPLTVQALLRDDRFARPVRHLRKQYADPITGKDEWGLITDPATGRILGIHSLSPLKPVKSANFPLHLTALAGRSAYSEWIFTREQSRRFVLSPPPVDSAARRAKMFNPMEAFVPEKQSSPEADRMPVPNRASPQELIEP